MKFVGSLLFSGIAVLFFTGSALAETSEKTRCKDVRLDQAGGPFEKIPVYDQEKFYQRLEGAEAGKRDLSASGENLCYAVVASQLIDAQRFSKGDSLTKLSSPLSLALNHKASRKEVAIEGMDGSDDYDVLGPGNPILALMTNHNQSVCDQKWLENYAAMMDSSRPGADENSNTGRSVASFFKGTFDQIKKVGEAKAGLSRKEEDVLNEYYRCRSSAAGSRLSDILEATRAALNEAKPIPQARSFLQKLCKEHSFRVEPPRPKFSTGRDAVGDRELESELARARSSNDDTALMVASRKLEISQKNRMKETISRLLTDKKPTPVGIGYCHHMVTGASPRVCHEANHTSVIIGQRWKGGSCEVLIRDSYGEEACKKSSYPCDNGSMWIPMDDLIDYTSDVGLYWLQ